MKAININEKLQLFNKNWHPHQIATVDNMQVIVAKFNGEFVWHKHEEEDELFQVIKGTLYMQFRSGNLSSKTFKTWTEVVKEGEFIVVPKGQEHHPMTRNNEEVHVMLFEKLTTGHTGNVDHEKTQKYYPKI